MPNHKSSLKRVRQTKKRTLRNNSIKSALKTVLKYVDTSISEGDAEKVQESFAKAIPAIDRAASKGVIHKRNAARKKSRLAKRVNQALA